MMRKRIFILMMVLSLVLSGCQLAKPDAGAQEGNDMLVGFFLTEEYLDLFDIDAYMKDNASDLFGNKNLTVENPEQYSGRIWAQFVEEEDGHGSYQFENLEGILLASYQIRPHGSNENTYWGSEVSEGICDVSFGHKSLDTGSELSISGTVYFSDTYPEPSLYFNPVYQTPDGDVYLLGGTGTSFSTGFGGSATQSIKEETKRTEKGEETSHSSVITVTMECVLPARSLVILQMDKENNILSRLEVDPAADTEELKPEANCAYILVEEHTTDGVRRSLYQKEDRSLSFFRELENKLCTKVQIPLTWPEYKTCLSLWE